MGAGWGLLGMVWSGGESHGEERRNEVLKREVVVGCSPLFGESCSCGVEKEQGWKQRDQLGGFR